ncbi:N utilization substance protein B [Bacteroidia bacterium]|nr:N utilization substance protein B [Bacteroidia bacterium]
MNRTLIRIKVLQIVFAYCQKGDLDVYSAEKEVLRSLRKLSDLYHYLLLLITVLTDMEQKRWNADKYKYLPTNEEVAIHSRFIDNRFSKQLCRNQNLRRFLDTHGYLWNDGDQTFLKNLLDRILESPEYQDYLASPDTYDSDREFWLRIMEQMERLAEEMDDILEEKCIFWNSDWSIVLASVLKTIRKFNEFTPTTLPLLSMSMQEDEKEFALRLLHFAFANKDAHDALIDDYVRNWEIRRLSAFDLCVLEVGLAEIQLFQDIPINVSINEYVELSHYYGSPKSSAFVNGILDAIVTDWKDSGRLFKD